MTHQSPLATVPKSSDVETLPSTQGGFRMTKGNLRLVSSRAVIGTVPPRRKPNAELRTREYLIEPEVERLIKAAKANRHGQRDATMILLAFRHGLRAAELVDLRWDQVELGRNACLHVRRVKNGIATTHPLQGDEMRALRELKRSADSPFVFVSERGAPFTRAGFAKMVARLGQEAGFKFGVHPHMLRHACGYALANRGHDTRALQAYLGHKNIQHTVRYTELSPTRFKGFWRA
jgi:integrase